MAQVEVKVPDIGDFKDVEVIELLVKPGDAIKAEQSLVTVESDKASMEIPSSAAGVIKALKVKLGDKVSEGSVLALVESEGAGPSPRPGLQAGPAPEAAESPQGLSAAPTHPHPSPQRGEGISPPASPARAGEGRGEGGSAELLVPDIGDFADVAVIEVFVKPGDAVKVEQSLITVESDKASMEIPASQAGVIREVNV
jgi:pyruvate dehydrogenase E2 component (dihydrolipoamide acetyltransferase)